jgi:hypothetical protein
LKAVRENKHITYKGHTNHQSHSRLLSRNIKSKKRCGEVFLALNDNNFNPRIPSLAKVSFKIDGTIKVFHDKHKLKQYMTTKPPLQKIFQEILHRGRETQPNHERAGNTKLQEKKKQESRE